MNLQAIPAQILNHYTTCVPAKGEEESFVLELQGRQRTSSTGEQWTNTITAPYGQHRLQTHLISLPLRTSDERHKE